MDVNIWYAPALLVREGQGRNMAYAVYKPIWSNKNRMGHGREPPQAIRATIYSI